MLNVAVGQTPSVVQVNRSLICKHSAFFEQACANVSRRQDWGIFLPGIQTQIFRIYVHWISGEATDLLAVVSELIESAAEGLPEQVRTWSVMFTWCEVWATGWKLEDVGFTNQVMKHMLELDVQSAKAFVRQAWSINHVSSHTGPGTALWRWLVDVVVAVIDEQDIEDGAKEWRQDVCLAVLRQLVARKVSCEQGRMPTPADSCKYRAEDEDPQR